MAANISLGNLKCKDFVYKLPGKKPEVIKRKCERKYVPLKEQTQTLADLKRYDSTENIELSASSIKVVKREESISVIIGSKQQLE